MCDSYVDSDGYTLCSIGLEPISGGDEVVCADGPCDDDTCCVVPGEREGVLSTWFATYLVQRHTLSTVVESGVTARIYSAVPWSTDLSSDRSIFVVRLLLS